MTHESRHRLVVPRERLRADFQALRRSLEAYRGFLAGLGPTGAAGAAGDGDALALLRRQHHALLQARASLGAGELAVALLREVLGRLSIPALHFQVHTAPPLGPQGAGGAGGTAPAAPPTDLTRLIASLHAAAETAPLELHDKLQRVLAGIMDFFAALAAENAASIEAAVARVNLLTANAQSRSLLREIAIVTRDVYNTLQAVSAELPLDSLSQSSNGISEAVQRLNTVMARLDDAATQNLDSLEQVNRVSEEEAESLRGVIGTLRVSQRRLMDLKAAHPELEADLNRVQERLSDEVGAPVMTLLHQLAGSVEHHMELISNQSFQELTSRTLKKIVDFVQSLEAELVDLLKQYRPTGDAALAADTPQAPDAGPRQSQTDVDKLLGELGF